MEVEIELRSDDPSLDLVSLRNYLEEHTEGLTLQIRPQPAPEGEMSIGWQALGEGIIDGF